VAWQFLLSDAFANPLAGTQVIKDKRYHHLVVGRRNSLTAD
jgi:hypothetical protein